ncbi:MAG: class I SAM-dependent methyltransferase [Clostridia bacterium]
MEKSTVDEIRARFDRDVERFSNLETGQTSTVDARLAMDLVTAAAAAVTPHARRLLDVGCGAGNYTLRMLERIPGLEVTLIDLSLPMLQRAQERLAASSARSVRPVQGDIRDVELEDEAFDIVLAAAVLHHLRTDDEWEAVFRKLYRSLAPGGSLWIFDLVASDLPPIQALQWERYGDYLVSLKGPGYRDEVFAYIEREDTPRSLVYQLDLMRAVGFRTVDVLHKNVTFAAFGGVK